MPRGQRAASPAAEAFGRFVLAAEARAIETAHRSMLGALGVEWLSVGELSTLLGACVPFRYAQLLAVLSARAAHPQYSLRAQEGSSGSTPSAPLQQRAGIRCVIVGAGPVGLRCAIELALLGCRVTVLEQRDAFSRLQVRRMWEADGTLIALMTPSSP